MLRLKLRCVGVRSTLCTGTALYPEPDTVCKVKYGRALTTTDKTTLTTFSRLRRIVRAHALAGRTFFCARAVLVLVLVFPPCLPLASLASLFDLPP